MGKEKIDTITEIRRLTYQVYRNRRAQERANSLPHNFAKGIVYGIATTLGATIIFGFILAFATEVLDVWKNIPVLEGIVVTEKTD